MKRSPLPKRAFGWYQPKKKEPKLPKEATPKQKPRKLQELKHNELEEKLDDAISEYVRRIASMPGGFVRCVTCRDIAHWKEFDCGHYISRVFRWTRWDLKNLGVQCPHCNRFIGGAQHIMRAHLVKLHGDEVITNMEYEATLHGETRRDREWMLEQIAYWRAELRRIRKNGCGD
jgi:hypothetical protein